MSNENSNKHRKPDMRQTAVSGSTIKGYWVILQHTYDLDGKHFPKGRMHFHTSQRPIMNKDWRRATQEEIDTKQISKDGNYFNLRFV